MKPAIYDFSRVRGTTDGFSFRLKTRDGSVTENMPFEDVVMTVSDGEEQPTVILTLALSNGRLTIANPFEAEINWTPTEAESRSLPQGPKAKYEVEVRNGTSRIVYLTGMITGLGGINTDVTP